MKKILIVLFFLASSATFAQKFGYIDSEYITSKMPSYQNTLEQMNQQSEKWVKEIQEKYNLLEQKQRKYKQEEVLLTDDLRKTRLKELEDLENEIRVQNNEIFGMNGKLFQKKKELMKPILDEIYLACQKVARQRQLMFIFDKASDISIIYSDPRHDYTDFVLEALGINKKTTTDSK
ncbi:MAG: OmpH family outer membrane protein [Spirosomataceae bacterium]